jgi:hypothetical protein
LQFLSINNILALNNNDFKESDGTRHVPAILYLAWSELMPLLNPAISGDCVLNEIFASNAEADLQTKRQSRPRAE